MAPKTAAELALAKKFELLRQKKAAAQAQQQQKDGNAQKAPPTHASQASKAEASKAQPAVPAKQSRHTPITFTSKAAPAEPSKPLTAHEKALQALKAAREGAGARSGIGRLLPKRAPATVARPNLNQQKRQGSSAPAASSAVQEGSAAPPERSASQPKQQVARRPARQLHRSAARESPDRKEGPQQKRQRTDMHAEPPSAATEQDDTVFVGDIPRGCGHHELQELFSELANVVNIRLFDHKGIAFVTVESEAQVGHIIDVADSAGLQIHGEMIRVARAHQPSDGPRGTQGPTEAPGAEPLKVQEARMAARALAEQVDVSGMPDVQLQPPPERGLVCYDDL